MGGGGGCDDGLRGAMWAACVVRMSGGGGDCRVVVGYDMEATLWGGVVACVCGDGVVEVDGCRGGCDGPSSMSILVLTSRSSISWCAIGGSKDVGSLEKSRE